MFVPPSLSLDFEHRQRAVFGVKGARIKGPIIRMNRFGDGGLLQRLQLCPELNNSATQEIVLQRFDEFALSRSFHCDAREQGNKSL